jgi:hypothetical protein
VTANADLPNVRRANRALTALWSSGVAPRPQLDAGALEAAALRSATRSALGLDDEWRVPFELLLRSLREEAELNPLGLTMAHGQIVMMLRARMRAAALWRTFPEILDRPIAAPIVVLGQMRSGTTRLQRLLACDDRFTFTRLHESVVPVPFGRTPASHDGRRWRARAGLALLHHLNPETGRIHPMSPSAPEEEFGLISFAFGSAQFEAQWRLPGFSRWWEGADLAPLYREFRALLQTNGWFRGEPADKPWILKAPQFLQDLPALLDAFPDARLLVLERGLDSVVASAASLVWNQMRVQSDRADKAWIGREWLRKTMLRRDRAAAALRSRPEVPQLQISFEAMNRDWRNEIARIYDFLGLDVPAPTEARMTAYIKGATEHLGHRYNLEEFGLPPQLELQAAAESPAAVPD